MRVRSTTIAGATAFAPPSLFVPRSLNSVSDTRRTPKPVACSLQLRISSSPSNSRPVLRVAGVLSPTGDDDNASHGGGGKGGRSRGGVGEDSIRSFSSVSNTRGISDTFCVSDSFPYSDAFCVSGPIVTSNPSGIFDPLGISAISDPIAASDPFRVSVPFASCDPLATSSPLGLSAISGPIPTSDPIGIFDPLGLCAIAGPVSTSGPFRVSDPIATCDPIGIFPFDLVISSNPTFRNRCSLLPTRSFSSVSNTHGIPPDPLSSSNPQLRNCSSHSSVFTVSPGLFRELRVVRVWISGGDDVNGVGHGDGGGGGGGGEGGSGLGGGGGGEDTRGWSGGDGEDSNNGSTFNPLKTLGLLVGYWSSRVAADPQFPSKVLMVGITACVSGYVVGNMVASQGRNELDFVVVPTLGVGCIVGGFTLMCLLGLMSVNDRLGSFVCKATVSAAAVFAVGPGISGTALSKGFTKMRKPNKPAFTMVKVVTGAICVIILLRPRDQTPNGNSSTDDEGGRPLLPLLFNPNFHMALLVVAALIDAGLSAYNALIEWVARVRSWILLLSVPTFCLLFP